MPDSQNRTLELHSPDGKSSCVLRCHDEALATNWFNVLHTNLHLLSQQSLIEANVTLSNTPSNNREVKHMGWLSEQVSII